MSKCLDLAKKLKALADRGVGGEKINAEVKLRELMDKHGFTMLDIEGDKVDYHKFKVMPGYTKLFAQIVVTIVGKGYDIFSERGKKNVLVLQTTSAIAIEVETGR